MTVFFIALIVCWKLSDFGGSTGKDACRAALSLERMAACPPKSVNFQEAVRPHDGAALSLVTSFGQAKEVTRAIT